MIRTLGVALSILLTSESLGLSAQSAAWQDVVRNLRNPNPESRLSAVARIGEAAYLPAAEPLAALIIDPDDRVQVAAIEAEISLFQSDRIGAARVLGLGGSRSKAQEAFEAGPLFRSALAAPPAVLERLVTAMRDENPRVRFDAVHALGFIAEAPLSGPAVRLLAAELDHYDPIMRAATARVLARLRVREAADQLVVATTDSNATVRLFATEALGILRDTRSAVELRSQLSRTRGAQFEATFLALARIGDRDDVEFFRARATDRNEVLRRAAFEGMARAGDKESIEQFTRALAGDRSDSVRTAAAFGLTLFGRSETHVIASHLVLPDIADQARDYLFEIGRPSIPALQATLKVVKDGRDRAALIQVIGYVGSSEDAAIVELLAGDKDERVRRAAAAALQRLRR